jgi:hypothetical protein
MSDLVVVAAALCGVVLALGGLGWMIPRLRTRFAGERNGIADGPLPGVGLVVAGLLLFAAAIGVFSDGADDGGGDVAASCQILARITPGKEAVSDQILADVDALLKVAPDEIAASVQTVRDAFAQKGAAAFEDPTLATSFKTVDAFRTRECSK